MKKVGIYFVAIAITLLLSFSAYAQQGNESSSHGRVVSVKAIKIKEEVRNYEKANGKTNAQAHREKVEKAVNELKVIAREKREVASQEDMEAKEGGGVSLSMEKLDDLEEVVEAVEEMEKESSGKIEKLEKGNKFKELLIGTDYKNLGELRSNLVINRNQIRQLVRVAESVEDEDIKTTIQDQVVVMMQERERIKDVIQERESGFSFLGWVFRFLTGYQSEPLDNEEENELVEDVQEVFEVEESDEQEPDENGTEEEDSDTSEIGNE